MSLSVNSPRYIGNIYGRNKGTSFAGGVYLPDGLAPTLNSMGGGNRQPLIVVKVNVRV